MPNQKIFCNVPWTNTHIYWDGSFGMCCAEKHTPHQEPSTYNLSNMSVVQWFKSKPMIQAREQIKQDTPLSACLQCYHEDRHGYESKRVKENFKSVIFTKDAFDRSYQQSPMRSVFETDIGDRMPVDWHVDLGNECNLACKMCLPQYSSKISYHHQKWKLIDTSFNSNWTRDPVAWQNFLASIDATPNLNRIHFMGGEPLLNKRFGEILDYLVSKQRTNVSISFVTNGTIVDQSIVDKLKQFRSCDIEVSLDSIESNNDYIRQGSSTKLVMDNIAKLVEQKSDTFQIVLRSVPQLLNINNYDQYILWAWQQQLPLQGVPLTIPRYLQISVLPVEIRKSFVANYQAVKDQIDKPEFQILSTGRNITTLSHSLINECDAMINMLNAPEPDDVEDLRQKLSTWLQRWDKEYGFNAYDYYPEYREFLDAIQYTI